MNKSWEHTQIFHNGDEFFTELISSIRRAKSLITLEFYIFEMDVITDILLVELQLAVLRGCEVRLMVDGVGTLFWLETLERRCRREGIFFKVYHPLPSFLQWLTRWPEALFSKTPSVFRRVNRRNHRKVVIVDRKEAFIGSINMTQVHFQRVMGQKAWRDTAIKVQGPAVESLMAAFELAWTFARKRALFPAHADYLREKIQVVSQWLPLLRLNANDKIRRFLYKDLCRRIRHSKTRVYVTTAYFLPKRAVAKALAKAALRGVDVRLLIPGPSDVPLVKWAAYQVPYRLKQAGVKISEYQPTVLHAKTMLIDDWGTIGSFNLNHRSLLHDLEVEAVLTDAESLGNMTQQFFNDWEQSQPFSLERYEQSSFWRMWIAKTLFKLRYWF